MNSLDVSRKSSHMEQLLNRLRSAYTTETVFNFLDSPGPQLGFGPVEEIWFVFVNGKSSHVQYRETNTP